MKKLTILALSLVTACDPIDSRLRIENTTTDSLFYVVSTTRELNEENLFYVKPSSYIVLGPQNGTLDPKTVTRIPSMFGIGTNTWETGINEHCEDSTLTIFFFSKLPTENTWNKPRQVIRTRTSELKANDWLIKLD
jgi:hypothetical protein